MLECQDQARLVMTIYSGCRRADADIIILIYQCYENGNADATDNDDAYGRDGKTCGRCRRVRANFFPVLC